MKSSNFLLPTLKKKYYKNLSPLNSKLVKVINCFYTKFYQIGSKRIKIDQNDSNLKKMDIQTPNSLLLKKLPDRPQWMVEL